MLNDLVSALRKKEFFYKLSEVKNATRLLLLWNKVQ